MKKFAVILATLLVCLLGTPAHATLFTYTAKVLDVTDGDTIKVSIDGWPAPFNPIGVRVYGVDTPEKRMPPAKSKCEVKLGLAASAYAHKTVRVGSTITVVYDDKHKDKYGRLLGTIALEDGRDYATLLIENGFAKPYAGKTKAIWCPRK